MKAYIQFDAMDCGPTCLRMIAKHYGKTYSLQYLREHCFITREGVSMLGISEAAEHIGLKTLCAKITLEQLCELVELPCILHWNQNHFVVCCKITGRGEKRKFHLADPAVGKVTCTTKEMRKHWLSTHVEGEDVGVALEVTPFLSQSTIDIGIKNRDLQFIVLIMIAQLVISVSQIAIGFIQSWISLHMNTRINISLISDYLVKLTRMPLHFFDTKQLGDILQRIGDHGRIKSFLMGDAIGIFFSVGTFLVFSVVLGIYNWMILLTFLIGNTFYVLWILAFMPYRRELDHKRFAASAKLQNNMVQFIQGMQEIKLNNVERIRRWEWERIQASLYRISIRGLRLGQIQSVGSIFFSTTTSILVPCQSYTSRYKSAGMLIFCEMFCHIEKYE